MPAQARPRTSPAVLGVGLEVNTCVVADALTSRTLVGARAVGTNLTRETFGAAKSAIVSIDLGVFANANAVEEAIWTSTRTHGADFATSTDVPASPTIIKINRIVHTRTITLGLALGAVVLALAVGAELTVDAGGSAGAAVEAV